MRAGIWGLVVPAAALGLAFGPIEAILGMSAPETEGTGAVLLGLLAGVIGLTLGWLVSAPRLLGPVYPWAQRGLAVGGGLTAWVGAPAMTVARGCERLESRLYASVLHVGRAGLSLAQLARANDEHRLDRAVFRVGRASLTTAQLARATDERRIDGLIAALVAAVQTWGDRARALQSGLVHRELAISASVTAVGLIALLVTMLRF
jgi:NADH-quinone oxidoreductase subunit L